MKKYFPVIVLAACMVAEAEPVNSTNSPSPDIPLEDLINIQVTSVSKKETSVEDSPAAISVITACGMARR